MPRKQLGLEICLKKQKIETGKRNKTINDRKTPKKISLAKRGWCTKNKEKEGISKGKTKAKQVKKTKKEEKNMLKQAFWGKNIEKPLKLQANSLFGPSYKAKAQNTGNKQNKTTPKRKWPKNTFLFAFWQTIPFFVNVCFFKVHSFMSAKLCFVENTINIVFSAEHSFLCITDSKTPETQNGTFENQKCHFGFCSVPAETPKPDCCNESARFFLTIRTQIVFAYFSLKCHFLQKNVFCSHPPPKKPFFCFLFEIILVHFSYFPCFPNKKDKDQKVHIFFRKPFLTPWQAAKNLSSRPYTLFVFLRCPQNTLKLGKTSKHLGPRLDPTLDQVLTLQHIHICVYYMRAVELLSGPSLAFSEVIIWSKFVFR